MKLSDLAIRKFPIPEKGQKTYWEQGFGLRVSQGGSKTFVCKHQGKLYTIGRYPEISLKDARKEAKRLQVQEAPKNRLQSLSDALTAYLRECEVKNRPKTVEQYRYYLSKLDRTNLSDIKRDDINLNSAHEVMSWKVFMNWCVRNELIERNPFSYAFARFHERNRVLAPDEIKLIWDYTYPPYSDYLKLLLLTGQRVGQWKQYEIRNSTIFFPATIMKNKRDHILPLTDYARTLLTNLPTFNGWSKAKARIDKNVSLPHWTVHDLRRTHSTIQAQLGTPIHVTERILSHTSGTVSGVGAIYNRYTYEPEMRAALETLEAHVLKLVEG